MLSTSWIVENWTVKKRGSMADPGFVRGCRSQFQRWRFQPKVPNFSSIKMKEIGPKEGSVSLVLLLALTMGLLTCHSLFQLCQTFQ